MWKQLKRILLRNYYIILEVEVPCVMTGKAFAKFIYKEKNPVSDFLSASML